MIKHIEGRRAEIEARKEQKRHDAMGLRERLENLELSIAMPAGANGRLYGAVTNQTIADELSKNGFHIERKRIELAGTGFKSVGKYKATIKLYENQSAEITITITALEIKTESHAAKPARRGRREERQELKNAPVQDEAAAQEPAEAVEAQTAEAQAQEQA
jgi:large subunit ribosomal protein L9